MAEGLGFGIGKHTYRMPFDHQGLLPEGADINDLAEWIRSIKRRDNRYGNGISRPWDTSGNNPMKGIEWTRKYRNMEKRIIDAGKISADYREAARKAKAYERKQALANASREEEQGLRERWRIEDELEEAGGALKSYHARRGNLAALKQKMTPSKGGMAPVAKTKERAYEEWAEKQKMMKEATRRAGL